MALCCYFFNPQPNFTSSPVDLKSLPHEFFSRQTRLQRSFDRLAMNLKSKIYNLQLTTRIGLRVKRVKLERQRCGSQREARESPFSSPPPRSYKQGGRQG